MTAESSQFWQRRLTKDDGLSNDAICSVYEDAQGFIWLGSDDGLNRYDGQEFKVFRSDADDSSSLSYSSISQITGDADGNIWAGTNGFGLNRLNRVTGRVQRFYADDADPHSISGNTIVALYRDSTDRIWILTDKSVQYYDPALPGFVSFEIELAQISTFTDRNFSYFLKHSGNSIWAGYSRNGLFFIEISSGNVTSFALHSADNQIDRVQTLYVGRPYWRKFVDTCLQLANCLIAAEEFRARPAQRPPGPGERYLKAAGLNFEYIEREESGAVWINVMGLQGQRSGLYYLDDNSPDAEPVQIAEGIVFAFLKSRSGLAWAGTNGGVVMISPSAVRRYGHSSADSASLSHPRIRSVHQDRRGELWVGTEKGLNRYDSSLGGWRHYFDGPDGRGSLSSNQVNVFYEDKSGRLYFGTNKGIDCYDPDSDRIVRSIALNRPGDFRSVWSIARQQDGSWWIGTRAHGIYVFDSGFRQIRHYSHDPLDSLSLSDNRVWSILLDHSGQLWAGTHIGLNRWRPEREGFQRFLHQPLTKDGLCGNNIWALYEDARRNLWITAFGGGISILSPTRDRFSNLTHKEGLPSNAVVGVLADDDGAMWIASNVGLHIYDPDANRFLGSFSKNNGLQDDLLLYKAFHKAANGMFYFGGTLGLSALRPAELSRQIPKPPPLEVSGIHVNDSLYRHTLGNDDALHLRREQNNITLTFTALDFRNPQRYSYRFQLEGWEEEWRNTGTRRTVSYNGLAPGRYILRGEAWSSYAPGSPSRIRLDIFVERPYWQEPVFRVAAGVAGSSVLFVIAYLFRVRSLRRQFAIDRNIVESRLQALQARMNPHFIFNALNSIRGLIDSQDNTAASDYLARFGHLVRMVLDHSKCNTIPLAEDIAMLRSYLELESLRFKGKFSYRINIEPAEVLDEVCIPPLLIQPYLENAIHHGLLPKPDGGSLTLDIRLADDILHCRIEDDGIGRQRSRELRQERGRLYRPVGMSLTRQRLEILNEHRSAKIFVRVSDVLNSEGRIDGTRVELRIPAVYNSEEWLASRFAQ